MRSMAERPSISIAVDDAVVLLAVLRDVHDSGGVVAEDVRNLLRRRIEWLEEALSERYS